MPAWQKIMHGEYNEHQTFIKGQKIVVYSDRDDESWSMTIGDDSAFDLEATDLHAALKEATSIASED
jgi:hypothetical protein